MVTWWARVWRFVKGWFEPEPLAPPPEPPTPPPPKPRADRYQAARLRRDILDQLAKYDGYIKRLKKHDPSTYRLYRRLGAYVFDGKVEASVRVESSFIRMMPSFGAIALALKDDDPELERGEHIWPRFCYFRKLSRLGPDIEQVNSGVTYRCTTYFDNEDTDILKRWGHGVSASLAINIAPDGIVRPLRMLHFEKQTIRHKRGSRRGTSTVIRHRKWDYPDLPGDKPLGKTREESALKIFSLIVNFWLAGAQQSMIRVTATKGNIVMPFLVDALKTPQFFADREKITNENGRTRPIFHVVRPHVRNGHDIKLHFAGLREFQWNGYGVRITVPGRDHVDHVEFDGGALENASDEEMANPDLADDAKIGKLLADLINAPDPHIVV